MQRSHNDFNPRAPYGARPLLRPAQAHAPWHFNPRAPYGARLASLGHGAWIYTDFNPRAPYGARHDLLNQPYKTGDISIHAPHMGRDKRGVGCGLRAVIFQSTRPIWGATGAMLGMSNWKSNISIHAPHMGRDTHCTPLCATGFYFNPRAPYGARLRLPSSTLLTMLISIHAPHMGRDDRRDGVNRRGFDFNPRAPYGARLFASL